MAPPAEDGSSAPTPAVLAPAGALRRFIELFAACGFALAQPLFEVFGQAPEQFTFRAATSLDIVLFAVVVLAVPPLVLWLLELVVGLLSAGAQQVLHLLLLGGLAAALAVQALASIDGAAVPVLVAVAGAAAFVLLYRRFAGVRLWIAFASLAPLGFAALFLLGSDTARLLEGTDVYDTSVDEPQPVVVLMLDELPLVTLLEEDGTIDEDLFPSFAALAEDSHWFRHTTSVASTTMYAVPAMLSGILPKGDAAAIVADHPDNLFTLLGNAYGLDVTESVTRLCPTSVCEPAPVDESGLWPLLRDAAHTMKVRLDPRASSGEVTAGFVEPVEQVDDGTDTERLLADSAANHPARFAAMLDRLGAVEPEGSSLTYVHLLLPHVPFRYTPDGTLYDEFDSGLGRYLGGWDVQPEYAELGHERHLLQALYADALLGDLLDRLHELDLYDHVTLVVAADHGIAFVPGKTTRAAFDGEQVSLDVASQLMYVPFFLKEAGQQSGDVDDHNVWTVDLLPTLADVIGADIPWKVDGISALGPPREEGPTSFFLNEFTETGTVRGPVQVADTTELWPEAMRHTIDHVFPGGSLADDPWRPWRVGPRRDLVGRPVADAPSGATEVAANLDPKVDLDLPARRTKAPVLFRGFPAHVEVGDEVAISVNGTITSTTRVLSDGSIAFLVQPSLYRTGPNDLRVLRLP
ncbi:MAG: sulfatase-like hydrolase/transferase [Acidimicrobiales bacterium]